MPACSAGWLLRNTFAGEKFPMRLAVIPFRVLPFGLKYCARDLGLETAGDGLRRAGVAAAAWGKHLVYGT